MNESLRNAANSEAVLSAESNAKTIASVLVCPGCFKDGDSHFVERYGRFELFHCVQCGLQFWNPRELPDAKWYEQMYGSRDERLLSLEPGHKYFLADPLAPGAGELLDIGCGTGNFLAAARDNGYRVTGTELNRNAARFAKEHLKLDCVLPLEIGEFAQQPTQKFDVITFFEVLEHQASPIEFLQNVKACLSPAGYIGLSVPNRERWMTGPDTLDYPPNHFLRWNAAALNSFLTNHGFEILSIKEEPAGFRYTAQMINMALRTGMTKQVAGTTTDSFRDVMQMAPEHAAAALRAKPSTRQKTVEFLGRMKYATCFLFAALSFPFVRMRGYKGGYLYCLARQKK